MDINNWNLTKVPVLSSCSETRFAKGISGNAIRILGLEGCGRNNTIGVLHLDLEELQRVHLGGQQVSAVSWVV